MRPVTRRGLTLIELLVVMAIIGVLIGLLLPAVQRVRDAAHRAECANNLKQIGLAAHQHHDSLKAFPAGIRLKKKRADPNHLSSWLTQLLPYLEQQQLWTATQAAYQKSRSPFKNPPHMGLATVVPVFTCPADARASQTQIAQRERYTVALTSYLGVQGKDLTTKDGVLFRNSRVRIADITDGTSNTLFAGERPPSTDFQYGWWYAGVGQRYTGSADMILGVQERNVLPIKPGSCAPGVYSFGPRAISIQSLPPLPNRGPYPIISSTGEIWKHALGKRTPTVIPRTTRPGRGQYPPRKP
jgi:prepilin-type N-terminal cleavage/methylation domain-containing protein